MSAASAELATVLADLAAVGKKLTETSEKALALLEAGEAECLSRVPQLVAQPPMQVKQSMVMTAEEVRSELRISRSSLGRLRSDPRAKFPAPLKRTKSLRWRREAVEAWIRRQV